MKQPSKEEFQRHHELFEQLIEQMGQKRWQKVKSFMNSDAGSYYMVAPASSKKDFHSAYDGGLLVHSLNVVRNLRRLQSTLCPGRFSDDTLNFVGLFHDLGKSGDGEEPYYLDQDSDWHRDKLGQFYKINDRCMPGSVAERSLFILQSYEIPVSQEEWLAIRLNDGQYVESNKEYALKEPDLALLLHWADMWSMKEEKSGS